MHNSAKIEKAYTFFIVPFYFEEGEWNAIHYRLDKWQPTTEDIYKEDVLYPYIMDIFKHNGDNGKTRLSIYEFHQVDKGESSLMFTERLFGKKQVAILAKNKEERKAPITISFTLLNKKGFRPLLFVSLTARIGIMTFPIEVTDIDDITNLTKLNYYLHKRNETDKYQCVCLSPNSQKDALWPTNAAEWTNRIPNLWSENQKTTRNNIDYICWNLNDFVDCMLRTMGRPRDGESSIKYFSKYRMQLFTFCSIQDPEDKVIKDDITHEALRLSRCVDAKYMLPFKQLEEQGALLQTYENIFFASSIEGTAMIAIGKKDNQEFISKIHDKFNRQYLLVYLLVLIQRYTLQSLEQRMTDYESTDKLSDDKLWNFIEIICRIKTNCYFTDVSIYTHHSQFYHLCCNCLHIPDTFEEIDNKIELLKLTTDRRMQRLMEAQHKLQEEEAKRQQGEIDRIKAVEAKEKDEAERRQHILNWGVALLTIAQVIQASYDIFSHKYEVSMWYSLGVGIICVVLLVMLMWKDIKAFFRNFFKTNQ